ncbi:hypothetical protein ACHAXT_011461 [Thalassiosira profunda]
MSEAKAKPPLPPPSPMPPSNGKSMKTPAPTKDKVAVHATQIAQASGKNSNISPVPARPNLKAMLTPAPGRLTPTGGRIKSPPVCRAPSLKRAASTIDAFNMEGVCFSVEEAEKCADKAVVVLGENAGTGSGRDDTPLNVEQCDPGFPVEAAASSRLADGKAFVSSSSTVITTSSASSCGRSAMGNEIAVVASLAVKRDPPLKVVRTDVEANAGDDTAQPAQSTNAMPSRASSSALSAGFTDNLIKGNSSRQGRSLQRWLVHAPTEALVRQVAGTIPITRDGRIVLVSASRKSEWILPKGGWDEDETKEECAARETFEEGGMLGRLGGCLGPIDYETRKSKKKRISQLENGADDEGKKQGTLEGSVGGGKGESVAKSDNGSGSRPPLPKRAKVGEAGLKSPTGPDMKAGPPPTAQAATSAAATPRDPKNHSYVRLFLFPLYVTTVKSDWPEKGRLRKLVNIDEAIRIMGAEDRLYFKRGLELVKERGLHSLKQEGGAE